MSEAIVMAGYLVLGVITAVCIFRSIAHEQGVDGSVYGGAISLGILWPGTWFIAALFWLVEHDKKKNA